MIGVVIFLILIIIIMVASAAYAAASGIIIINPASFVSKPIDDYEIVKYMNYKFGNRGFYSDTKCEYQEEMEHGLFAIRDGKLYAPYLTSYPRPIRVIDDKNFVVESIFTLKDRELYINGRKLRDRKWYKCEGEFPTLME